MHFSERKRGSTILLSYEKGLGAEKKAKSSPTSIEIIVEREAEEGVEEEEEEGEEQEALSTKKSKRIVKGKARLSVPEIQRKTCQNWTRFLGREGSSWMHPLQQLQLPTFSNFLKRWKFNLLLLQNR